MKKIIAILMCFIMLLSFAACGESKQEEPETKADESIVYEDITAVPDSSKQFTLNVVYQDESSDSFTINTGKTIVGDALKDENLIEGEEGAYGLYIKTVNGFTADYDIYGTYWAFYINGEKALQGIDQTEIEDGAVYELRVEK